MATVYLRKDKLYIESNSKTQDGFWIAIGAPEVIEKRQVEDIGPAIHAALEACQSRVPTPPPSEDLTGPLLERAGVKTWSTFANSAQCVGVVLEGGEITLTPHTRKKYEGAFAPIPDKKRVLAANSDGLGEAIIAVLADAT